MIDETHAEEGSGAEEGKWGGASDLILNRRRMPCPGRRTCSLGPAPQPRIPIPTELTGPTHFGLHLNSPTVARRVRDDQPRELPSFRFLINNKYSRLPPPHFVSRLCRKDSLNINLNAVLCHRDSPSHRIFGRMHEALNIDKKK